MADRSNRVFVLIAACLTLAACSARADDAPDPTPPQPVATSTTSAPASTTEPPPPSVTPPPETPALVPPSVIASAEPPPVAYTPPPTIPTPVVPPAPVTPAPDPETPALPPPDPVDSRGFPLGTTCGPVSCTSPDGLTFVNPEAVPGITDRAYDLVCGDTYCAPPGLQIRPDQLPGTGSAG